MTYTKIREPTIGILIFILVMTIQTLLTSDNSLNIGLALIMSISISIYGYHINSKTMLQTLMKTKIYACLIGGILIAIALLINIVMTNAELFQHIYKQYVWYQILNYVLISPILEELAYRQFLYGRIVKTHYMLGKILVGLLFILPHNPQTISEWLFYSISTIGLFVTYDISGKDIRTTIAIHALYNTILLI